VEPTVPPMTPTLPGLTLASTLCGIAALAVYTATLCPTVSGGDSGELIAVAHTLGIAHPPGYPLYTMLAKVFALVPIGSVAARINFFSAACDALAAFFLCRAAALLAGSVWSGVLAAGLFAFSPLVWPYAVTAEVFALNNLFAAALLWLSTLAQSTPDPDRRWKILTIAAFVLGLGLTNHHVLALLAGPVLALQVLWLGRATLTRGRLRWLGAAFCLGLLPYLYLFVAPRFGSEIAWGDTGTLQGFLDHVLRREYGTLQLADTSVAGHASALDRVAVLAERLTTTTRGAFPLLLLIALATLVRRGPARALVMVWLVGVGCFVFIFASLSNLSLTDQVHAAVQERFWQQAFLVLAALTGIGLTQLARVFPVARNAVVAVLALTLPAALAAWHFGAMDQSRHTFFRDYGEALLESLPPNALLLITSDEALGSVRYLQQIEGKRRDVRALPTGQLTRPWFRKLAARRFPGLVLPPTQDGDVFSALDFMDANRAASRIFLVNKIPWLATLEQTYSAVPVGLADEVLPKGERPPLQHWVDQGLASFNRFDPALARSDHDGAWERYVQDNYWRQFERFGLRVSSAGATHGSDPDAAANIVRALAPLAEHGPGANPTVLRNLGVAYQYLAARDPTARPKMIAAWKRYMAVAPASDRDRAIVGRALQAAEAAENGKK
jgi:hypothetical protein